MATHVSRFGHFIIIPAGMYLIVEHLNDQIMKIIIICVNL